MEKNIYNLFNTTRGELPINESVDLISVLGYISAGEQNTQLGIKLPENTSIVELTKNSENLKERLIEIISRSEIYNNLLKECMIKTIEKSNISNRNLQAIIANIQHIDLKNNSAKFIDTILEFGSEYSKLEGELKEPACIKQIATKVIQIEKGEVYDGTCGVGQLLIESNKIAGEENVKLYGQELNLRIWMLAQINLRMHGYRNFDIEYGDTLIEPKFKNGLQLKKFDYVTMNIPFGVKGIGYELLQEDLYNRFRYGLPTKANLDYSHMQQGIASLKDTGKAAIVVPTGVLFREAMDGRIRKNLIKDDIIEGIISLPPVFMSTGINVAILVFNKNKAENMKGKILFVKAEELGKKERRTTVLSQEEIDRIVNVYIEKKEEENFSRLVDIKEIEDNDYNLNVGRYIKDYKVVTSEGVINIDIEKFESKNTTILFKDLAKFERGMNLPKATDESTATHKAITLSDVQDGELILDNLTPVELKDIKRIEKYTVNKGDILLSGRGNAIKVAVVEDIPDNIIVSNNFIKITPNYNVNPYFIKAYLESPVGQYYIESNQTGTTIKVLSASDLYEIPVPMISVEEQNKVAEKTISSRNEYKESLKRLQQKLKEDTLNIYNDLQIAEVINKI
ncbi:N-6 DNA methylase [[Clostridium] dakarense]|uniref:N-6 DNA methylase n=1 Tax=Faecalimicrobium dakarense TaxID=1301100 RepID=UPI0004B4A244|nr:N-6 DNA methylase [[Clostridium] dakarense]